MVMFKKILLVFSAMLIALSSVFAASGEGSAVTDPVLAEDDLLLADVPVLYGDESFRERILERTGGQRDPVGLVLTGGSARAFAHLGVLKYLEEQGIEPDFIISNSMGSIIAMLYAAGMSPDQIMSVITSGDLSTFFKMTIPVNGGLLEPTGFRGLIESVVGPDAQVEEQRNEYRREEGESSQPRYGMLVDLSRVRLVKEFLFVGYEQYVRDEYDAQQDR